MAENIGNDLLLALDASICDSPGHHFQTYSEENKMPGFHKNGVYWTRAGEKICSKFNRKRCDKEDAHAKNGYQVMHRCTFVLICCSLPRLCLGRHTAMEHHLASAD